MVRHKALVNLERPLKKNPKFVKDRYSATRPIFKSWSNAVLSVRYITSTSHTPWGREDRVGRWILIAANPSSEEI